MIINILIDTDDKSVVVLTSNSAAKSADVNIAIDSILVKKIKEVLPKLAAKIRRINEDKERYSERSIQK